MFNSCIIYISFGILMKYLADWSQCLSQINLCQCRLWSSSMDLSVSRTWIFYPPRASRSQLCRSILVSKKYTVFYSICIKPMSNIFLWSEFFTLSGQYSQMEVLREDVPKKAAVLLDFVQITSPPLPPIWTTCTFFFLRRNSRFESQFRTKNTIFTL